MEGTVEAVVAFATNLGLLMFALLLAWLCEGLFEYLFDPWLVLLAKRQPFDVLVPKLKPWIAAAVGIGIVFLTSLDLLAFAASLADQSINPILSKVLTGIVVGRGANYVHDFWKRLKLPNDA